MVLLLEEAGLELLDTVSKGPVVLSKLGVFSGDSVKLEADLLDKLLVTLLLSK